MAARSLYVAAALLFGASALGIRHGNRAVSHYAATLPGGIPAVLYEPGPPRRFGDAIPRDRRYPVVILAHGFAASQGAMGVLARRLARAGYAVITFDFRGHGANRAPFDPGWSSEGLYGDIEAAVAWAASRPNLDPERLALAGHSMGAGAVIGYASREPGAAAVVAISGGNVPEGPYEIPNPLLIWASGDPDALRLRLREVGAHFAGLERLVPDRVYGDRDRGAAVEISEVEGVDHLTILYSAEAARRIVTWLRETVGAPSEGSEPRFDGRLLFVVLGLASALLLLFGLSGLLAGRLPVGASAAAPKPFVPILELVGAHAAALVLLAGLETAGGRRMGLLPLLGAEDIAAFLLASGFALWLILLLRGASALGIAPSGRGALVGLALFAGSYLLLVTALSPIWDLRLFPHRVIWAAAAALLVLPFFLATESRLRAPELAPWVDAAGKAVTLLFVAGGAAVGLLPFVVLLALGGLVLLFVLSELVGLPFAARTSDRFAPALAQALLVGWTLGALFPLTR